MEDKELPNGCIIDETTEAVCQIERKCKKSKKFIKKGLYILNKNFGTKHINAEYCENEFCVSDVGNVIFIVNGGLTTGADSATILDLFLSSGIKDVEDVIMVPGKQYSFVILKDFLEAKKAVNALSGVKCLLNNDSPLYMDCINKVPSIQNVIKYGLPPGLIIFEDFISVDEELMLSNLIKWDDKPNTCGEGSTLKNREVRHFGYEFSYSSNQVDKLSPLDRSIPDKLIPICERIVGEKLMKELPDQLTVNRYMPGQGIPPHVDTHSAFSEEIVSLSILGSVAMEFKSEHSNDIKCSKVDESYESSYYSVYLPARSLCVMTGPSRYLFTHGISSRKTDIVPLEGNSKNLALSKRTERISFTFRKLRNGDCACEYPIKCDSQNYGKSDEQNVCSISQNIHNKSSSDLEKDHVLNVYEEIAEHFDQTRHKPWPKVLQFVQSVPKGTILLDVGCGNGKYLSGNKDIFSMGVDNCSKLLKICKEKKFETCLSNCLSLPFRSNSIGAVICIAVIHHLSSQERRVQALSELIRVLQKDGVGLVYVWAMEQRKGEALSAYLKQNKANRVGKVHKRAESEDRNKSENLSNSKINTNCKSEEQSSNLLIHENRTDFMEQDMFVPWKRKNNTKKPEERPKQMEAIYHRYYHVFREGELENLISNFNSVKILSSYYDEGNWCVSFKKTCLS